MERRLKCWGCIKYLKAISSINYNILKDFISGILKVNTNMSLH